jgi:pyruvate formate lyase activating enzyme
MYPERLAAVLPLLDWVGLDIKGPLHAYDGITGVPGSGKRAWESLQLVVQSGVPYECRTTWNPALFDLDALKDLGETLVDSGVTHWALQQCRAPGLAASEGLPPVVETLGERFASFSVRRG